MTYTTAQGNTGSLTHCARAGIEPATSWFLVGFVNHCAKTGTPEKRFSNETRKCLKKKKNKNHKLPLAYLTSFFTKVDNDLAKKKHDEKLLHANLK